MSVFRRHLQTMLHFICSIIYKREERDEGERKTVWKHLFIAAIKLFEINYGLRFIKMFALANCHTFIARDIFFPSTHPPTHPPTHTHKYTHSTVIAVWTNHQKHWFIMQIRRVLNTATMEITLWSDMLWEKHTCAASDYGPSKEPCLYEHSYHTHTHSPVVEHRALEGYDVPGHL